MKVLVGITGSIGAVHVPFYTAFLKQNFSEIKIILSQAAQTFVSKKALAYVGGEIYTNLFPPPEKKDGSHAQLAKWADLFLILPATANILAEAAQGLAGSLLAATILCHDKPVLFFPNMNDAMWNAAATKRNVTLLRDYGHLVVPPAMQVGIEHASGMKQEGEYMPSPIDVVSIAKEEGEKRRKCEAQNV